MNQDELERALRDAVSPSPQAAERVVRAALGQASERPAWPRVVVVCSTILVLLGTVWVYREKERTPGAPSLRLSNMGDTIIVEQQAGSIWLIGPSRPGQADVPSGPVVIQSLGERK